ncbi:MAG: acetylornithine deacetylase [Sulfitobacter sp.]
MNTLEILDKLVAFDTVSAASNLQLIAYAQDLLKANGFRVTRLPSPCGNKAGLYAEIGPQVAGGLLLSGHTDVVPTDGQTWTKPPFKLTQEGGKLFGRGTTDMKGFIASALALAVKAKDLRLQRPLAVVLSYDEEIGCVGMQEIRADLAPLLRAPALCIVGEPTEMEVATGHKGKAAFNATFHGQSGHSALAPNFTNALHLAADFMGELRGIQAELAEEGPFDTAYEVPYTTLHVGKLSGGTALNIVPALAEMQFEMRTLALQDVSVLNDRIDGIVSKMNAARISVSLERGNTYPGLDVDAAQSWVKNVAGLAQNGLTKVAFGTEAGILSEMGIPTLVCGPGSMEGQGHKADEFVETQQLAACDDLLDRMIQSSHWCGALP